MGALGDRSVSETAAVEMWNNAFVNCSQTISSGAVTGISASSGNAAYAWAQLNTLAFQGGVTYSVRMDFHLTASTPSTVRLGGLDSSSATYGSVSTDKDGLSRTCPAAGTDCYSIGPYELDS